MKTFRRDKLKRLIEAGRVVTVDTYHFDDMTGESRSDTVRPVGLTKSGPDMWKERKEGTCYLFPSDFTSKSGTCYESGFHGASGDLLVTLIVHGNSNYTFRILKDPMKTMVGTVARMDGRYFVVECPDAPAHLRTLNLVPSQMATAAVGDWVELAYQVTSRSGLWNVVRVLAMATAPVIE